MSDPIYPTGSAEGDLAQSESGDILPDENAPAGREEPSRAVRPERRTFSPLLAGVVGAVAGAAIALAIALPITLGRSSDLQGELDAIAARESAAAEAESARLETFDNAVSACGYPSGIEVADEGGTLTFDHEGEEDFGGADILDIGCVLGSLGMPERVATHMNQTTSMDGRQTETWDQFEIQWSYHPDRGMDGVVSLTQ